MRYALFSLVIAGLAHGATPCGYCPDIEKDHKAHPNRYYFTWQEPFERWMTPVPTPEGERLAMGIFQVLSSLSWSMDVAKPRFLTDRRQVAIFEPSAYHRYSGDRDYEKVWSKLLESCRSAPELPVADFPCSFDLLMEDPSLYNLWLGYPETEAELLIALGIDPLQQTLNTLAGNGSVIRVTADRDETFAELGRYFSRYQTKHGGYYWRSHERRANSERTDYYRHPLLGEATPLGHPGLQLGYDFVEAVFSLPNGMQAYLISDGQGRIAAQAPTQWVREAGRRTSKPGLRGGFQCAGCHWNGVVDPRVSRADPEPAFNRFWRASIDDPILRNALTLLFQPSASVTKRILQDRSHFHRAQEQVGLRNNGVATWIQADD